MQRLQLRAAVTHRAAAIAEMAFVGVLLIVTVGMSLRMVVQLVSAVFF